MCKFYYHLCDGFYRNLQRATWLRRLAVTDLRRKSIAVRVVALNYWSGRRLITEKIDKQTTEQHVDGGMILSTYPDFAHDCGDFTQCGNTCCVPSNGTAQAMAGG